MRARAGIGCAAVLPGCGGGDPGRSSASTRPDEVTLTPGPGDHRVGTIHEQGQVGRLVVSAP